MQLAGPTPISIPAPVTKAFNVSYVHGQDFSPEKPTAALQQVADEHGVFLSDVAFTGPVLESLPPWGGASGTLTGQSSAVDNALKAVELLQL